LIVYALREVRIVKDDFPAISAKSQRGLSFCLYVLKIAISEQNSENGTLLSTLQI
jgi:hypothetical protein